MESNEEPEMYVCDPVYTKEGVKGCTHYKLKGNKVPETLNRRYKEFNALRKKLVERWPGIFVPNIPEKKIGQKGKRITNMRVELINRFLKKLCKIDYLYNSEEMEYFLQNTSSVCKTLDGLKLENYEDLLRKYSEVFTEYDDNFDTDAGRQELENFEKKLNKIHPKIKNFRYIVSHARDRYKIDHENYTEVISMLSLYEKESLNKFVNNNEDKLIFFNIKNVDLCNNISKVQEEVINPYDRLYNAINEDVLNIEAMIEALETLKGLHDSYNKLTKNLNNTNMELTELQSGKTSVKTMFKKKDKTIDKLSEGKENLEKDIDNLGQVIKIATFNMQSTIQEFKTTSLDNYYAELSRIESDTEKNATIFDNLWEAVIKDKNISEFN